MSSKVAINSFVKRQNAESPFAHFLGTWDHLREMVEDNIEEKVAGDKPGSWLVPLDSIYFMSAVTPFFPGVQVKAEFKPRREGEEPYLNITVPGHKAAARIAHAVLYEHQLLGKEAETNSDYEVIALLASPAETQPPMDPVTMMRNYLERPGGTKAGYTAEEFARSILFWSQHAMTEPVK